MFVSTSKSKSAIKEEITKKMLGEKKDEEEEKIKKN